ncbi:hypothetical protein TVAG_498480 [Trichomonas vaginalis G3]|uniref:Importin N-terminal domain-containing protein n=1 Tax=Trichomonas vaginalis (strain ATCC PRA-98 / G3) TaxID=412133 RepID=A2E836_TRIV3|nr:armadillo (ARM) repeat-containing protein family [Trichomonas vaginalis G3]EAY11154.1 hypothetical protein TVAG_498480 [Trichomonas vaginalis G3]KAI5488780.1 armadillo (ARM) repeat-containing protein family [Trichomonas vaginalis G3]|eukprot:XP_001323377.1 hypothetical protein [Trichomonas vaginalis G3]
MDESNLLKIIEGSNSDDDAVRGTSEAQIEELLQNDPLFVLNSFLNLILANSNQSISQRMIIQLFSIVKHMTRFLSTEILMNFLNSLISNVQALFNPENGYMGQSIIPSVLCNIYSLIISLVHKFSPEATIDYNEIVSQLVQVLQPNFTIPIIAEAIEDSADLYNFNPDVLYQFIIDNESFPNAIIRLYFAIIGKIQEGKNYVELLPQILSKITDDNVLSSISYINNFCEQSSPFMEFVFLDLSNYLGNLILNQVSDQIKINCLYTISSLVTKNSSYLVNSSEFAEIFFKISISIFNDSNYQDLEDENSTSIANIHQEICHDVFLKLDMLFSNNKSNFLEFIGQNQNYLFGYLIFLSFCYNHSDIELVDQVLEENSDNINLKYACMKIYSDAVSKTNDEDSLDVFSNVIEFLNSGEDEAIVYLILKGISKRNFYSKKVNSDLEIETWDNLSHYVLEGFSNGWNEKIVEKLIFVLSACIEMNENYSIEDSLATFDQIFNEYESSDTIRAAIVKVIPRLLDHFNEEKNQQIIEQAAFAYYEVCANSLNDESINPKNIPTYMSSMLKFIKFAGNLLDDKLEYLFNSSFNAVSQELQFTEVKKDTLADLSAYYATESMITGTKYVIEKSTVDTITDYISIILSIVDKEQFKYYLVDNEYNVMNQLVNLCVNYIQADIYSIEICTKCFELLRSLYDSEIAEEKHEELLGILIECFKRICKYNFDNGILLIHILTFARDEKDQIKQNEEAKQNFMDLLINNILTTYSLAKNTIKGNLEDTQQYLYFEQFTTGENFGNAIFTFRKICSDMLIQPFQEKIIPLVMENKEVKSLYQMNITLLNFYLTLFQDDSEYEKYRGYIFDYIALLRSNKEDDDDDETVAENYSKNMCDELFTTLYSVIKYIDMRQEFVVELHQILYDLFEHSDCFVRRGDFPFCLMLIYLKYPFITEEMDISEVISFVSVDLMFFADPYKLYDLNYSHCFVFNKISLFWLENYWPFLIENHEEIHKSGEDGSLLESIFAGWGSDMDIKIKCESKRELHKKYKRFFYRLIELCMHNRSIIQNIQTFFRAEKENGKYLSKQAVNNWTSVFNLYFKKFMQEHARQ